jgi:hypothetical protein
MSPSFEGLNADRRVSVVRRGDQDSIRVRRLQKVIRRVKSLDGRKPSQAFRHRIADRREFATGNVAIDDALRVDGPHRPDSDNSKFHRLHTEYLPLLTLHPSAERSFQEITLEAEKNHQDRQHRQGGVS